MENIQKKKKFNTDTHKNANIMIIVIIYRNMKDITITINYIAINIYQLI